jgi:2-amino-4-hydroxy-6-hydroxymethyldihydropteridine diphosphokinase
MPTAYIGMGGNLASAAGPPDATLAAAVNRLQSLGRVTCRSSLYSTAPVGYAAQPRFVNAVVALETGLPPRALLQGLMRIEQEFGRDRTAGFQNGPRTLDLDILLYGDLRVSEPGLEIPHPRMADRAFVMVPLAEIAPYKGDATDLKSVAQWHNTLESSARSNADEVVSIQSDVWCPCACGGGLFPRDP